MLFNHPYLKDRDFLALFDKQRMREEFVKITILDYLSEQPLEQIQGKVTSGNINLNGSSAQRRTANLTVLLDDNNYQLLQVRNSLSINKKIAIEIGITNNPNSALYADAKFSKYKKEKIIWFPQGIYVIITPNISYSSSGLTAGLQIRDKMTLLDGTCAGHLPATVTFDTMTTIDTVGVAIQEKVPIFKIIQQLVHHYGNQPLERIIINDVPLRAREVIQWNGAKELYRQTSVSNGEISYSISKKKPTNMTGVETLFSGADIGYRYTDFTYPGQLVAAAGETICNVLDKIKNTLGNYQYFYDIYGNFVFQEKKNYLNTSYASTQISTMAKANSDSLDLTPSRYLVSHNAVSAYDFSDSELIISYTNNPQYVNIKNDFIVWGERTGSTGLKFPIRYHLAIDSKPTPGTHDNYYFFTYINPVDLIKKVEVIPVWDNTNTNDSTTIYKLISNNNKNKRTQKDGQFYYVKLANDKNSFVCQYSYGNYYFIESKVPANDQGVYGAYQAHLLTQLKTEDVGKTPPKNMEGEYYITPQLKLYVVKNQKYTAVSNAEFHRNITTTRTARNWRSQLYLQGVIADRTGIDRNYYYTELKNEWPKLYNYSRSADEQGYSQGIITNASIQDYWLDLISPNSAMGQFSVPAIGRRTKVVVDNKINCIFQPEIPNIYLTKDKAEVDQCKANKVPYINLVDDENSEDYLWGQLGIGGRRKSAFAKVQELLYEFTGYNETVSISMIPIFHLEPNVRITVNNKEASIFGDFIINTISIPLGVSGNMNISATRALERI